MGDRLTEVDDRSISTTTCECGLITVVRTLNRCRTVVTNLVVTTRPLPDMALYDRGMAKLRRLAKAAYYGGNKGG